MSDGFLLGDAPQLALDEILDLIDWKDIEIASGAIDAATIEAKAGVRSAQTVETPVKPPKKKRVRREVVELKYLREKVKELEDELGQLTYRSTESEGDLALDGFVTSMWASVAGRQLNDRMRAEKENKRLRGMLEDQLKVAQGLETILKQLPTEDYPVNSYASVSLLNEGSLSEALARMEEAYCSAEQVLEVEGAMRLKPNTHEFQAMLHPVYGMCVRFTANFVMAYKHETVKRVMWQSIQQSILVSERSSITKIHSSEDIEARRFAIEIDDLQPPRNFWAYQVMRKYEDEERTVLIGRSVFQPFVKDESHPAGVGFFDDARLVIRDCSDGTAPATSLKACGYLVPDLAADPPGRSVGIGELTQFCINIAAPRIAKGHGIMDALLFQEEWLRTLGSEEVD